MIKINFQIDFSNEKPLSRLRIVIQKKLYFNVTFFRGKMSVGYHPKKWNYESRNEAIYDGPGL
jgi:hypothetical protein